MNNEKFKKTQILNINERNVRAYTICDESIYLKIENIPLSFLKNLVFVISINKLKRTIRRNFSCNARKKFLIHFVTINKIT